MTSFLETGQFYVSSLDTNIEDAFKKLIGKNFCIKEENTFEKIDIDGSYIFRKEIVYATKYDTIHLALIEENLEVFVAKLEIKKRRMFNKEKVLEKINNYQIFLESIFNVTGFSPTALYDAALTSTQEVVNIQKFPA